jgi:hypothetical protein
MIDSVQVIYDFLTDDTGSDLYALVETRCWSPVVNQGFNNESPALVYRIVSELTNTTAERLLLTVEFRCLGGSGKHSDAGLVYRALKEKMHGQENQVETSGRICKAEMQSATQGMLDGDTGWPVVMVNYQIAITS